MVIDNIELDTTNTEFNNALDFVLHTNKLVYLTGKAGTGKTTFLKYLRETVSRNMVILAPTGVAAINAGGQTIHSFFNIRPGIYPPIDKRLREKADLNDLDKSTIYDYFHYSNDRLKIIQNLDLLIIDEISMVRCDLLDLIDTLLKVFRKRRNEPFGGVQVILIGDTFQLSPIVKDQDWEILQQFYKSTFFFSSYVILQNKPAYIELKKIYRQTEQEFIDLLNKVRINQISSEEIKMLNSRYNPSFIPKGNENYIVLATHNRIVDQTNLEKLEKLQSKIYQYDSIVIGDFPEKNMPTDRILYLKVGAQVMFIKNDKDKRYYNGKIAKVKSIQENDIIIETSEGDCFLLEKQDWTNYKYSWNEKEKRIKEEFIGSFTQYPVKLAWAITVHKSQGLTFEHVIADLGSAFASGQVYVALSRCKTLSGLQLKTKIDQSVIKTDEKVLEFAKNEMPSTLVIMELNSGKADFYYKIVRNAINNLDFEKAYVNLLLAIKLRNDIDTDLFKRIFSVLATKLGLFKSRYEDILKESINLKDENAKKQHLLERHVLNIQQLEIQNKTQIERNTELEENSKNIRTENTELHDSISTLNENIQKLVKKIHKQENVFDEMKAQNNNLLTEIQKSNLKLEDAKKQTITLKETSKNEIKSHKNTIIELEIKIKQFDNELKYQKNLKWYHKIF